MTKLGDHQLHPETMMLNYGFDPSKHSNSLKAPVFLTSTFTFKSAEEGKRIFRICHGEEEPQPGEDTLYCYSRINNPNLVFIEKRLAIYDQTDDAIMSTSGMGAITTFIMTFCKPGDAIISTDPVYGGTHHLFTDYLKTIGVEVYMLPADAEKQDFEKAFEMAKKAGKKVKVLYTESPSNPTIKFVDFEMLKALKDKYSTEDNKIILAADNTFMGPVFCTPTKYGVDVILYSATKFLSGSSDLVSGFISGPTALMNQVRGTRAQFGTQGSPFTAWMLTRSMETIKIRMETQAKTSEKVAEFLAQHPKIAGVTYPTLLDKSGKQYALYKKYFTGPGSLMSVDVKGGEKEAFKLLNSFKLAKLCVSLGSSETLVQHPKAMTHSCLPLEDLNKQKILDTTLRVSIGLENAEDLIEDFKQALDKV